MSKFKNFLFNKIQKHEPVFFDGGMGTMIQKISGLSYSIPEDLNFYNPEAIKDIHKNIYLQEATFAPQTHSAQILSSLKTHLIQHKNLLKKESL